MISPNSERQSQDSSLDLDFENPIEQAVDFAQRAYWDCLVKSSPVESTHSDLCERSRIVYRYENGAEPSESDWTALTRSGNEMREALCKFTRSAHHPSTMVILTLAHPGPQIPNDFDVEHRPIPGRDELKRRNKRLADLIRNWADQCDDYDNRVWPTIEEGLIKDPVEFGEPEG